MRAYVIGLAVLVSGCDSPGGGGGVQNPCLNPEQHPVEGVCECVDTTLITYESACLEPDGDEDLDTLTNQEEIDLGTDLGRVDTDGDGAADPNDSAPTDPHVQ